MGFVAMCAPRPSLLSDVTINVVRRRQEEDREQDQEEVGRDQRPAPLRSGWIASGRGAGQRQPSRSSDLPPRWPHAAPDEDGRRPQDREQNSDTEASSGCRPTDAEQEA